MISRHNYLFDVLLNASVRFYAASEDEARRALNDAFDCVELTFQINLQNVTFEAGLSDAMTPSLVEVDDVPQPHACIIHQAAVMRDGVPALVAAARAAEQVLAEQHANCGGGEDTMYAKPLQDLRAALRAFPDNAAPHYKRQFPDYDDDLAPYIAKLGGDWGDVSWRNDACPSLQSESLGLQLFIDYRDGSKSEMQGSERFQLLRLTDTDKVDLLYTNEFQDVLNWLQTNGGAA